MTLAVLNVAYPLSVVTEDPVGGAEQVLVAIDRALVDAGATSIVVACEGSRPRGLLWPTPFRHGALDAAACAAARAAHARGIADVLERFPVDVVHLHGVDFHAYLPPADVPALATLHLPLEWYPPDALTPSRPRTFVHCVSEAQRRACPSSPALLSTIENGVALPARGVVRRRADYVVALGRICPEKGFHLALDAAAAARVPMFLAGRVFEYPEHVRYHRCEIVPRLDGLRRFVGPVAAERKQTLLATARCVLIPSLVAETSSLVAMEALAAGTPVIAFANGALPEIIEDGVTGFLVHDVREMAEAIAVVAELDPDACRAAAEQRFSVDVMTRRYLERYAALARDAGPDEPPHQRTRAIPVVSERSAPLDVTELRTEAAVRAILPEWSRLCDLAPCTPFQRPEWLLPWWRHFGIGALCALAVRRDGELIGLAPMYIRHGTPRGRKLSFIGAGNSDYLDLLAPAAWRDDVATHVVSWIARGPGKWDECELGPLPSTSALLAARAPEGWRATIEPWGTCPVLMADGPSRGIERAIPTRLLAQLRYERRRLAGTHHVEIEEGDQGNVSRLLEELFALHGARWQARGERGVLDDEPTRRFHLDVAAGFAETGLLRLYVLRLDGRAAAAFYGFAHRGTLYYYLGGFDPAFRQRSVGSLVVLHAIEAASAQGIAALDFLLGAEGYKYRWGATDQPVHGWRLRATTVAARGNGQ